MTILPNYKDVEWRAYFLNAHLKVNNPDMVIEYATECRDFYIKNGIAVDSSVDADKSISFKGEKIHIE